MCGHRGQGHKTHSEGWQGEWMGQESVDLHPVSYQQSTLVSFNHAHD